MRLNNKTLLVFIFFDIVFLACACLLIGIPVLGHQALAGTPSLRSVAQVLLLDDCPLTAAIVNGIVMLITFGISIPAIFLKKNRLLLTIHTWLLLLSAIISLSVGLIIWFLTLQTKKNLAPIWNAQTPLVQAVLQVKFDCCGYNNSTIFVTDSRVCTNATAAANLGPCVVPFSAFANQFLDIVFTTMFGFCAVDVLLLLSGLCVLKDRAEKARYELIDEKGPNRRLYSKF